LSAANFPHVVSYRARRSFLNLIQFALPIAFVFYIGLFARMANVLETFVVLFVCGAFVCFSLFSCTMFELFERLGQASRH